MGEEEILLVNSYQDFAEKLAQIEDKDHVKKLSVIIPGNYSEWTVVGIMNGKHDYVNRNYRFETVIEQLPPVICEFKNIEFLDISHLGLKELDPQIERFKALKTLNISYNPIAIENEVSKFATLTNLKTLIAFDCIVTDWAAMSLRDLENDVKFLYKLSDKINYHDEYYGWKQPFLQKRYTDDLRNELLSVIYKYYAIGAPAVQQNYPGYQELLNIINKKNYSDTDRSLDKEWETFSNTLNGDLENVESIFSNEYSTSPCRSIKVRFLEKTYDKYVEKSELHIVKSRLVKYYTVFYKKRIVFKDYFEYSDSPYQKFFIHGERSMSTSEKESFNRVISYLKNKFPDYQFIEHRYLMKRSVKGGLPFGENIDHIQESYSYYDYLFYFDLQSDLEIIE